MNKEQSLKAVDKVINAYKIERAVDVCDIFSYDVFENAYRMHAPQIASLCNVNPAITGALVAGLVSTKILELVVLKKHYLTHEINKYRTMKKLIYYLFLILHYQARKINCFFELFGGI